MTDLIAWEPSNVARKIIRTRGTTLTSQTQEVSTDTEVENEDSSQSRVFYRDPYAFDRIAVRFDLGDYNDD